MVLFFKKRRKYHVKYEDNNAIDSIEKKKKYSQPTNTQSVNAYFHNTPLDGSTDIIFE